MDDHHESPQPEIQAFCTYVVIIHIQDDTDPDDIVRIAGVFMNFKDAIACLKNQRLTIEDGFIPQRTPPREISTPSATASDISKEAMERTSAGVTLGGAKRYRITPTVHGSRRPRSGAGVTRFTISRS
jgi:hypothetical protein